MAIIVESTEQGSVEWMALRLGNPGASNISKIITTKGEPSKQRDDYIRQLTGEIIVGQPEDTFQSVHMENGLLREAEARALFEMIYGVDVRKVALVYKNGIKQFHVSPDGLIGDNAGIEIKCPMMKTHVKYLLENKLPAEYFSQVQMSLYVCECEYWYFMSYFAGLPPLILKIERDTEFLAKLEKELDRFVIELALTVKKLRAMS